jgi:hypothetical protein
MSRLKLARSQSGFTVVEVLVAMEQHYASSLVGDRDNSEAAA